MLDFLLGRRHVLLSIAISAWLSPAAVPAIEVKANAKVPARIHAPATRLGGVLPSGLGGRAAPGASLSAPVLKPLSTLPAPGAAPAARSVPEPLSQQLPAAQFSAVPAARPEAPAAAMPGQAPAGRESADEAFDPKVPEGGAAQAAGSQMGQRVQGGTAYRQLLQSLPAQIAAKELSSAPDSYRAELAKKQAPKVALGGIISEKGSSAIVFEGQLGGIAVAVKTYRSPGRSDGWNSDMGYFKQELRKAGLLDKILGPAGMAPKVFGEVDIGPQGNPSFAMEKIHGRLSDELTPAQAETLITSESMRQVVRAIERLNAKGLGGRDSPQPMILTEDQVIHGVLKKAGDVVFMDAAALMTRERRSSWFTPQEAAEELAYYKAQARRLRAEYPDVPMESMVLPDDVRAALRVEARAMVERALASAPARYFLNSEPAARVAANGSGDSAASVEAMHRVAAEAAKGQARYIIDVRSGKASPMQGVDSVDMHAGPHQIIVQRGVGKIEWTVLSSDPGLSMSRVRALLPRLTSDLPALPAP
ncbi:MAG: hypothetical protein WC881_04060 [Elusimicrobiota bacterium]|jgi:hypothetical protein